MSHTETKERLSRAVAALESDEGFQRWLRLRTTTTIGRYSIYNQLLIAHQMEEATRVAGYRAWQRGRQVKKGSKAIYIFAPLADKDRREAGQGDGQTDKLMLLSHPIGQSVNHRSGTDNPARNDTD